MRDSACLCARIQIRNTLYAGKATRLEISPVGMEVEVTIN